ncbi:sugar-binding transcriptional regulator [Jiangella sp. DSM 45060]|uniref:sugar-binding transcriptional regulator n=1 Tax=Jiangella sp. DSM 45060 TaxID=1798224 RepID=UPI00087D87AA|nr:sugar-binding transcriptional regulator [Jiangella sp. DSM 45060]SDT46720.1 DNA-binding transcriptional regulator LsrR, DeoR family [Jiangella sp. DSM 45060]
MTESPPDALTPSVELLTRVASLYHLEGMTQEEIAAKLGLSRPKVGRLLKQARDIGIVEITVHVHPSLAMPLESELSARFGLRVIVAGDQPDETAQRAQVGKAAATALDRLLIDGATVTVGMGRNVKAVSEQAAGLRQRPCTVISGIGGSAQVGDGLNSNDIATRLADALGGRFEGVYAPAYVESTQLRDTFLGHADIGRTLSRASHADIAVVGIGDAVPDSLVVRLGCISAEEMARLREDGAVGDILGHFVNAEGAPIAEWIEQRVVGLTRDDLRKIPQVIAVASEATKAPAILGAVRSGLIGTLVISVTTARGLLAAAQAHTP